MSLPDDSEIQCITCIKRNMMKRKKSTQLKPSGSDCVSILTECF